MTKIQALLQNYTHRDFAIPALIIAALAWSVASSLLAYPHSLGYFNEIAGRGDGEHRHLLNSNIEWGQDLLYLKEWCDAHPDAKPLFVATDGFYDPDALGISCVNMNTVKYKWNDKSRELVPGWYAIGVNESVRRGMLGSAVQSLESNDDPVWRKLRRLQPVTRIGGSIDLYYVTDR